MPKFNISGAFKALSMSAAEHLPGILTAVGVTGMVTSIIFAVRATPKALELIEEEKEEKQVEKLDPISTVKVTWKCYIPTVATAALSTVCIIEGCHVNNRRNAALAAAYTLSDSAFREYQQKVVETVGEKKEDKIRSDVAQEKANREVQRDKPIIITGRGTQRCYDSLSQRTFESDIETLRQKANDLNDAIQDEMFISVNEWYDAIGLPYYDPPGSTAAGREVGDNIGWENGKGKIKLEFDSILIDGVPHVYVGYQIVPKYYR